MNVLKSLILSNIGHKVKYLTFNPAECPAIINFEQYWAQSKILHTRIQTHSYSNLFKKYINLCSITHLLWFLFILQKTINLPDE